LVAERLPPNGRIADVATGTGIFLRSIASSYPYAILEGFDISPALFPDKESLPQNVSLSALDAKQPIPPLLRERYDLVHVRYISMGIMPNEWVAVVRNLSTLVRPGGTLQWAECDILSLEIRRSRLDSTVDALRSMNVWLRQALQPHYEQGWDSLDENMRIAGLVDVERNIVRADRVAETRRDLAINNLLSCSMVARSGKVETKLTITELDALERQAHNDIESGAYLHYHIHVLRGSKPSRQHIDSSKARVGL
jgi:hypothetical protein